MPCSTIVPSFITRITSASRMVESLWAMTKLVRPFISAFIAFWMCTSVRVSTELVASSSMSTDRICENRAGYSQKLTLTLRDIFAVLLEHGLIPVGQSAYEVVNPCGLRRADDLLARAALTSVGDILHYRALKQPCVLEHHAEYAAQIFARDRADIVPVEKNFASVYVIEAHEQVDKCGLAAPVGPTIATS